MSDYERRLGRLEQNLGVGVPVLRVIYNGRCSGCREMAPACRCGRASGNVQHILLDGQGVRFVYTGVPPSEVYP